MLLTEDELRHVYDRESLFAVLEKLGWRVSAEDTYTYPYDGPTLSENVAPRVQVSQIPPFGGDDPFAFILAEFETPFRRGDLREILKAIRANIRTRAAYGGKSLDRIIFVCATQNYEGVRFARFEQQAGGRPPTLRVFGWERGQRDGMRTLRYVNMEALRLTSNTLGEPDWQQAEPRWQEAWSVEKVTKDFYDDYDHVFKRVEAGLSGELENRRLFTQRLFNRLMFIRFLQKKGWLRFQSNPDFLRALFTASRDAGENFYRDRLYWLFFSGLGTQNDNRETHTLLQLRERRGDVPYLNGGLFEMEPGDELDAVSVENAAFEEVLALFEKYNFTITESAPDDVDVAVDPEMLGRVFERLVTGRHETGSYYTPRPVVAYMCREGLKGYLTRACPQEPAEVIEALVEQHDASRLQNAEAVMDALRAIQVCDPACGSGAYLLGMMQELLALRQCLFASSIKDYATVYRRKLEIVQRSLYGVDIDPFAVNIAMLRLWLSLVIDDKRDPLDASLPPSARDVSLPDLKFKIQRGDSLAMPIMTGSSLYADAYAQDASRLRRLHDEYFASHDADGRHARPKAAIEQDIAAAETEIAALFDMEPEDPNAPKRIRWQVAFAEVFAAQSPLTTLGGAMNFGQELAETSEPGGFDIVLANPPYVRQELIKEQKPTLKAVFPTIYAGTADLYTYFYARAVQLLKPGGMLVFISSNKWFRAGYGANLRQYIAEQCGVWSITDFGDLPVFENTSAYPMIFIARKKVADCLAQYVPVGKGIGDEGVRFTLVKSLEPPYPDVLAIVENEGQRLSSDALNGANWTLTDNVSADRMRKMQQAGVPLGEYIQGRINYGIKTGFNTAFVITGARRAELIEQDPRSAEVIRPFATGKELRRWHMDLKDKWLIVTKIGIDIERYPAVFAHLCQWQAELEKRWDKGENWWELRACAYYDVLDRPKIVYPDIALEPRFALDRTGTFLGNTGYFFPSDDLYVLGVLNSRSVADYYIEKSAQVRGGYLRFFSQYVERIPIPDAPDTERQAIAALVQKCLDAKGVGCEAWEQEINERVAALYGL